MGTNELINAFKELDLIDKKKELADELTELAMVIRKLNNDININNMGDNSNFRKLYDINSSDDEYLVSIFSNIINLKEELAMYLDKISDVLYE